MSRLLVEQGANARKDGEEKLTSTWLSSPSLLPPDRHGLTWTIIEALSDRISERTGRDVMAARG